MDFNSLDRGLAGLDRSLTSLSRAFKKEKREKKRKEILEKLVFVAESMRKRGASEASIRTAVKGMYEYLKVMLGERWTAIRVWANHFSPSILRPV